MAVQAIRSKEPGRVVTTSALSSSVFTQSAVCSRARRTIASRFIRELAGGAFLIGDTCCAFLTLALGADASVFGSVRFEISSTLRACASSITAGDTIFRAVQTNVVGAAELVTLALFRRDALVFVGHEVIIWAVTSVAGIVVPVSVSAGSALVYRVACVTVIRALIPSIIGDALLVSVEIAIRAGALLPDWVPDSAVFAHFIHIRNAGF